MTEKMSEIADRDLMAYFDDELDEAEIEALEAALEEDDEAKIKLADLGLVRDVLRDEVNADERGDGIADAVMAKLEAESDASGEDDAPEDDAPADDIQLKKTPIGAAAANDNSRSIWTMAAAAAAVAAGLWVWGIGGQDEPTALAPTNAATVEAPAVPVEPAPETVGEMADTAPAAGAGADDEDAVEIAQLDFGDEQHTGSIFKVENENTGVQTAVVWVTETGDDEE